MSSIHVRYTDEHRLFTQGAIEKDSSSISKVVAVSLVSSRPCDSPLGSDFWLCTLSTRVILDKSHSVFVSVFLTCHKGGGWGREVGGDCTRLGVTNIYVVNAMITPSQHTLMHWSYIHTNRHMCTHTPPGCIMADITNPSQIPSSLPPNTASQSSTQTLEDFYFLTWFASWVET
jgi:hypothetical protein